MKILGCDQQYDIELMDDFNQWFYLLAVHSRPEPIGYKSIIEYIFWRKKNG